MKLSNQLLSAITLGVALTTLVTTTSSCEKEKTEKKRDRTTPEEPQPEDTPACPACGMG